MSEAKSFIYVCYVVVRNATKFAITADFWAQAISTKLKSGGRVKIKHRHSNMGSVHLKYKAKCQPLVGNS